MRALLLPEWGAVRPAHPRIVISRSLAALPRVLHIVAALAILLLGVNAADAHDVPSELRVHAFVKTGG